MASNIYRFEELTASENLREVSTVQPVPKEVALRTFEFDSLSGKLTGIDNSNTLHDRT